MTTLYWHNFQAAFYTQNKHRKTNSVHGEVETRGQWVEKASLKWKISSQDKTEQVASASGKECH